MANFTVQLGSEMRAVKTIKLENKESGNHQEIKVQELRYRHINLLKKCLQNADANAQGCLNEFLAHAAQMEDYNENGGVKGEYIGGLVRDAKSSVEREGQISIALSKM